MSEPLHVGTRVRVGLVCHVHPSGPTFLSRREAHDFRVLLPGKLGTVETRHRYLTNGHTACVRFDEPERIGETLVLADCFAPTELILLAEDPPPCE